MGLNTYLTYVINKFNSIQHTIHMFVQSQQQLQFVFVCIGLWKIVKRFHFNPIAFGFFLTVITRCSCYAVATIVQGGKAKGLSNQQVCCYLFLTQFIKRPYKQSSNHPLRGLFTIVVLPGFLGNQRVNKISVGINAKVLEWQIMCGYTHAHSLMTF